MKGQKRISAVRVPAVLSALSAIGIILGKFLAINVTDFMRFSLENITVIFVGIVFGPLLGAAVGAVQDLVGCIAVGYAINPIITLGSAAIGAVSGAVFLSLKRLPKELRITFSVMCAHATGSVLIKSLGLSIFYSSPFGITVAWRLLNYVIVGAVEAILLCLLLKSKQLLSQINKITLFSLNTKFRSANEAAAYAKSVSGVFSKPGLERVERLISALSSPEKSVKVVHIAGTNGKGSTSAMLQSILAASGLKVGSFTSPYLIEMRESIRICGEPISEEELLSLFERLRPIADATEDKPTEFELLTAAAYLAFKEAELDVAVIECGMGGERDATNVIDSPLISVITGISVDHTSFLGNTVEEIAAEKAGIIKRGCPVLVGNADSRAMAIIKKRADSLSAEIHFPAEPTIKSMTLDGTVMDYEQIKDIRLPLLGAYQPANASLAIAAAELIKIHFPTITDDTIRLGISCARWHARFELICEEPTVIFDGAHNLDGTVCAVKSISTYFDEKIICLTGVLADKDYEAMADEIAKIADTAVTVTPVSPRALKAEDYARVLSDRSVVAYPADSISDGVKMAVKIAKEKTLPIVCLGSLYLYPDVIKALKNRDLDK